MSSEATFKPCCEAAQAVYDCPRCGDRECQDASLYAYFVTCARNAPADGRLCGETAQEKGHPILEPGVTYPSFRPGFAHLIGFYCTVHGWTLRREAQTELFPGMP